MVFMRFMDVFVVRVVTAFLMNEKLDNSTLWERYSMLNNIYSKIYDRNIKLALILLYIE